MNLELLLLIGGVLHFGILIASALVPQVLDWKTSLRQLNPLLRQLIWVHGAFIVLVIIGFGLIAALLSHDLADGSSLSRAMCAFIALFWGARLLVQFMVFDAKPFLTRIHLRIGYHLLTCCFAYLTIAFAWGALGR